MIDLLKKISREDKNQIYFENIDFNEIKKYPEKFFNLEKIGDSIYFYKSKAFKILNLTIDPEIFIRMENISEKNFFVSFIKININQFELQKSSIDLTINFEVFPKEEGIMLKRCVKISVREKLKIWFLPLLINDFLIDKVLKLICDRLDRKLKKMINKNMDISKTNIS